MSKKKAPTTNKKQKGKKSAAAKKGKVYTNPNNKTIEKELPIEKDSKSSKPGKKNSKIPFILFSVAFAALLILILFFFRTGKTPGEKFAGLLSGETIDKPNIILFTLDTLRADHLPSYGYPGVETPHMDALSRQGVVFEQCTSSTNLTLPSHSSIMTGTYPTYHGIRVNGSTALSGVHQTLAELFAGNGYMCGAFIAAFVLDGRWGLKQGFHHYDDKFELKKYKHIDLGRVQRPANEMVDAALEWMDKKKDKPFFSWIHLYDPHTPYSPPEPYYSRYKNRLNGLYDGEIAYTDEQIGRCVQWLKDNNLDKNTIIVLLGDHGEGLGSHGEMTHGYYIYDYAVQVPLIMATPFDELKGVRVASQVRTIDVYATLLEMAGISIPAANQGESLLPLAFNPAESKDRPAYSESMVPDIQYGWSALYSLRTSDYKYIDAPKPELYDLRNDPGETENLWKSRQSIVREFKKDLLHIQKTSAVGAPDPESANLDKETMRRLASLGYAGTPVSRRKSKNSSLEDPKDKREIYEAISRASEHFANDDFETAAKELETVMKQEPDIPQAMLILANSYAKLDRRDEAKVYLDRLLKRDPNNLQALNCLANVLSKMGKKEDVITLCKKAIAVDALNSQAYTLIGETYIDDGNHKEALPYLQKAVEIQPKMNRTRLNLAICYLGLKRYDDSSALLDAIITKYPKYPMANFHMGLLKEEMSNFEEAASFYRLELKHYENCIQARFNYGKLLFRQGDLDGYIKEMQKLTEIAPKFPKGYLFLARGLLKKGSPPDESLVLIEKGISLADDTEPGLKALGYFLMADVYSRKKQPAKVKEALVKADYYKKKGRKKEVPKVH
ncbi:MAG: sulfatase-like hydrolase/transferase [bacterium]|nr:sulfatase-like hydrolase/transferase [bacterium]